MSRFLFSDTGNIIFGILKIGKNNPEISYFEFENHKNLNFSIFRRVVRARKKIYLYKYYLGFFKDMSELKQPGGNSTEQSTHSALQCTALSSNTYILYIYSSASQILYFIALQALS